MSQNNNGLSVLDMVDEYAKETNTKPEDIFTPNKPAPAPEAPAEVTADAKPAMKQPWTPDASLTADMPELHAAPVTFSKDEYREEDTDHTLKNIADDNAIKESREAMDSLERTAANIEDAKKRHGILKFQIPEGQYHASITAAAGDTDYRRGQNKLDELFDEIEKDFPEFILERTPEYLAAHGEAVPQSTADKIIDLPQQSADEDAPVSDLPSSDSAPASTNGSEVQVVIDKRSAPEVSWTEEDLNKIKRARTIELNIVESSNIAFGEIEDVPSNMVDMVLAKYQRKMHDIDAPLPASKYRCTFTGLTYPEVLDLDNSVRMDNLDGERKKWSICFDHIKNQSIGPWEEYVLYRDPNTHKEVRVASISEVPDDVLEDNVHEVTKFEDFLRKTSYMDLEYMLWKILCATAMEHEIVSIDCHATHNGKPCGKTYDWVYAPNDLLQQDKMDATVLQEMETTMAVSTLDDIMKNYNTSPVAANNTVKLNTSGWLVVFGHASAYDYLNDLYGAIAEIDEEQKNNNDPTIVSRALAIAALTVVKAILIPKEDGGYIRITGTDNLVKVIRMMDEVDWQTTSRLVKLMMEPYQIEFALRDIVCPQCHNRSNIKIRSMMNLLFIVAQSLSNVQIDLKSN